jgi:malate dehydrogenase (oxaloacetate-decarboxylating)
MDDDFRKAALDYHRLPQPGKLAIEPTKRMATQLDLSLAYSPGVAAVCEAIVADPHAAYDYTTRGNLVGVISNGTAVLGLGNIGPAAAMPVMEGKAALFKHFAGVDAVPICLDCTDPEEIVETVVRLAPSFGGINLEDISAPRCFAIESLLQARLGIPVFHDDQHGTAIVALAALTNAATLTGRTLGDLRVVVSGAGASGTAVTRILLAAGIGDIVVGDSKGLLHPSRTDLTPVKAALSAETNKAGLAGSIESALRGADVFVGLSAGTVAEAAVASMASGSIVFAMANPDPEVSPEVAARHARIVATGRSDYPNQINNVLAFPGVFRGALDVRASRVTEGMKLAAAEALAGVVKDELTDNRIIPSPFDGRVAPAVATAVADRARADGVARR